MVNSNEYDDLNDEIPIPEAAYADLYELGFWNYKKAKLTIIWGREVNKNKQILLLRKLCPQLNEISLSRIYQIVQEKGERWQFAEMRWGDAMDIFKEAQRKGLNVIIEEVGRN